MLNAGGYFTPEGSDSIEVPTDSLETYLDLSTDLTYIYYVIGPGNLIWGRVG